MELNHEFCDKFRGEIKARGLAYIVKELLTSSSAKVPLKKKYLARECAKKKKFAAAFKQVCEEIKENNRSLKSALTSLQQEVLSGN